MNKPLPNRYYKYLCPQCYMMGRTSSFIPCRKHRLRPDKEQLPLVIAVSLPQDDSDLHVFPNIKYACSICCWWSRQIIAPGLLMDSKKLREHLQQHIQTLEIKSNGALIKEKIDVHRNLIRTFALNGQWVFEEWSERTPQKPLYEGNLPHEIHEDACKELMQKLDGLNSPIQTLESDLNTCNCLSEIYPGCGDLSEFSKQAIQDKLSTLKERQKTILIALPKEIT